MEINFLSWILEITMLKGNFCVWNCPARQIYTSKEEEIHELILADSRTANDQVQRDPKEDGGRVYFEKLSCWSQIKTIFLLAWLCIITNVKQKKKILSRKKNNVQSYCNRLPLVWWLIRYFGQHQRRDESSSALYIWRGASHHHFCATAYHLGQQVWTENISKKSDYKKLSQLYIRPFDIKRIGKLVARQHPLPKSKRIHLTLKVSQIKPVVNNILSPLFRLSPPTTEWPQPTVTCWVFALTTGIFSTLYTW